jgi:hypothetical protein
MKSSERVGMMNCRKIVPLTLVVLALATAASATISPLLGPSTSTTALSGGGGRVINVSVTSSVWKYSDYISLNPSASSVTSAKYIYEYILTNLSTSNVSLSMFQVPISGPTLISGIGTVANGSGTIDATSMIVDQDSLPSATYLFMSPALGISKTSYKLVYSSNGEWAETTATVAGGSIIGDMKQWTPVPEPVSALLLGIGGLALIGKRTGK